VKVKENGKEAFCILLFCCLLFVVYKYKTAEERERRTHTQKPKKICTVDEWHV
jgi:hypothetical protein